MGVLSAFRKGFVRGYKYSHKPIVTKNVPIPSPKKIIGEVNKAKLSIGSIFSKLTSKSTSKISKNHIVYTASVLGAGVVGGLIYKEGYNSGKAHNKRKQITYY